MQAAIPRSDDVSSGVPVRHIRRLDPNARDQFKHESWFQLTVDFCAKYDEVSFDPAYRNEPMSTFAPMVHRVLNKPCVPPAKA